MESPVDISVVIVNYNVKDLVDTCISSIYKANNNKFKIEIFFVDNNSIDGSVELIRNKYPEVFIFANNENVGFSKANNIALKKVTGKYILILNPDTVLEEGTFEKLIKFCESDSKIGAVTSKLIQANGKLDGACKRSFPTLSVALPKVLGLSKLFPKSKLFGKYNLTYLDENSVHQVEAICGAFMFIPKVVIDKVGLFDEDYFMYGEDLDLCYRINKNGYKIIYFPEVTTIHLKGESTSKTNISYVNNFYGAMNIFAKKNLSGGSFILSFLIQIGIFYRSFFSYINRFFKYFIFPVLDILILYFAFVTSINYRFKIFPNTQYIFIISIYIFIWFILFSLLKVYTKKYKYSLQKAFNAVFLGFFINSSITYFLKQYAYSREVILTSTFIALVFILFYRSVIIIYRYFIKKNIMMNKVNLLIIGEQELSQDIEEKLLSKFNVKYFDKITDKRDVNTLQEIIKIKYIDQVVFTGDYYTNQDILKTMWAFQDKNVVFKIVPKGNDLILSKLYSNISDISLVEIEYNINNKMNIFLKRGFDIVLSSILLILYYPFIKIFDLIFPKKLNGHKSKLLLLPKVFSGKYSFVGVPVWFDKKEYEYLGKKGLTGILQLNNYEDINEEERLNYCIFYAKNQSLLMDIEIILKTIFFMFKKNK